MPFLLNEDAAIKLQLSGITVTDGTSDSRKVTVRYVNPEDDLVQYTPPMILISMPTISLAFDRMGAGGLSMLEGTFQTQLPYVPEGHGKWWPDGAESYDPGTSPYFADVQPYNLDYQVTVMTRINRQHMLPVLAELEQPTRLGRNATLAIPQDGTYRTIYRMGGPARQNYAYQDGPLQKKLFTATYMIRIPTEVVGPVTDTRDENAFPLADNIRLDVAYARALSNTDLSEYYTEDDLSPVEAAESIGILGVRQQTSWNTGSGD